MRSEGFRRLGFWVFGFGAMPNPHFFQTYLFIKGYVNVEMAKAGRTRRVEPA